MGQDGVVSGPETRQPTVPAQSPPTRSRESRVLAGVCGGLARRTDIDPVIYRVAFGILGCLGVGLVLYGAAWLLLPQDGDEESGVERLLRRRIDGPAVLALLVAVLVVGGLIPSDFGSPTIALVVVLGVAALAAARRGVDLAGALRSVPTRLRFPPPPQGASSSAQSPAAHGTGTPSAPSASDETYAGPEDTHAGPEAPQPADQPTTNVPPVSPGDESRTWPRDPAESPAYVPGAAHPDASTQWLYGPAPGEAPRTAEMPGVGGTPGPFASPAYSYDPTETFPAAQGQRTGGGLLTLITVSAALIVAGTLTAITLAGAARLGPEFILAAVIVTIGAGLLVGTLYGRGRPLVAVGLPLSVLLIAVTAVSHPQGASLLDGFGQRSWQPTGKVEQPYHLAAGEGTLDLTDLPPGDSYDMAADVGLGELRVRVPSTAEVTVHAQADLGTIRLDGNEVAGGYDLSATRTLPPGDSRDERTSIELDLGVRMGEVVVERVSP